ncbi:MAG: MFS transporter [Candidatus Heritagella sp.]
MKFKLTAQEKKWILYDVGNSAFVLLVSTILPIYFNALAQGAGLSQVEYLAYWGYAAAAATFLVALLGPLLGAVSDRRGRKKPLFFASVLLGVLCCSLLGFVDHWLWFLIVFIIAKIGYSGSLIFYDSMLGDITENDRMDSVSSQGYAWGYIGSCLPFLLCLGLVLGADFLGLSMAQAMLLSFLIVAVWWIGCTVPLLRSYRQKHYVEEKVRQNEFTQLWHTIKEAAKNKQILFFILAFFFYIDGVYTIIDMATAYGTALGFDTAGLLLALLATQIVAFPSSILIGRLSRKYGAVRLISLCILAYFGIAVFAVFLSSPVHFWILAVAVGMFQGGIQALSRSHFTKIIPPEKSGEYFGLLDICGKGASLLGTLTVSAVSQITGNANLGVGAIAVFFLIGLFFFLRSVRPGQTE